MPVTPESAATNLPSADLPSWSEPRVDCYETRPEVTAYAGEGARWTSR
jgi:hypothetical protein